jgi:hypothetical protein
MDVQSLLDEVGELELQVAGAAPGDPRLAGVIARIGELERELEQMRGLAQPLVPDAARPPTAEEKSLASLERALHSIRAAAESKR